MPFVIKRQDIDGTDRTSLIERFLNVVFMPIGRLTSSPYDRLRPRDFVVAGTLLIAVSCPELIPVGQRIIQGLPPLSEYIKAPNRWATGTYYYIPVSTMFQIFLIFATPSVYLIFGGVYFNYFYARQRKNGHELDDPAAGTISEDT